MIFFYSKPLGKFSDGRPWYGNAPVGKQSNGSLRVTEATTLATTLRVTGATHRSLEGLLVYESVSDEQQGI